MPPRSLRDQLPAAVDQVARYSMAKALASDKGFTLIKDKRPEPGTFARTARQQSVAGILDNGSVSIMNWVDPDLDAKIIDRSVTGNQASYIQNAFTYAPLNGVLTAPPGTFRIGTQIDIERAVSFVAQGAYFLGIVDDPTKYLLNIQLDLTSLEEGRRLFYDHVFVQQAETLDCAGAINLEAQTGVKLPQHLFQHNGCKYAVPDDATGYAVRIAGVDSQQHMFRGCEIENGVHLDGCADANRFKENWFLGKKRSLINLTPGAFKTRFIENICVASDGFLDIIGGSQIDIIGNQCEHPDPATGTIKATIIIRPTTYDSLRIKIEDNNFGGGNVGYSVYVAGDGGAAVRDLEIGINTWGITDVADLRINDSNVHYTRTSPVQQVRGQRSSLVYNPVYPTIETNTRDVNSLFNVQDFGTGTAGVRLNATRLGGASATALDNSWTCDAKMYCMKDPSNDIVSFNGWATGPAGAQIAIVIATLPVGFRPDIDQIIPVTGFDLGTGAKVDGLITVQTNGSVICDRPASTNNVRIGLSPIRFHATRQGYQPGY